MQITREDLNPCTVVLTVVCDPEEVKDGYNRAYKQIAKKIKMPGFRPGHVPKHMIEKSVDPAEVNDEAAEQIVKETFKLAIDKEKLKPEVTVRPSVDLTLLDQEENRCEYKVTVALPPVVELGDAKKLPVEKPMLPTTDDEVNHQIEEMRKRQGSREAVTGRGAQESDVAVVSIRPEGEDGDGRNFMIVVGQTFAQLDQLLTGMAVEEMRSASIHFPKNFQDKDWANKTVQCQVSLNSLSSVSLPEVDDDFAKKLKLDNVDELKDKVKGFIEHAKEEALHELLSEKLLDALLTRSTVHVPDAMWEGLAYRRLKETEEEQRTAGKTLEQYAAENGMTLEALAEAWRQKAKVHVMRALLIRELFTKEKMQLADTDLEKELLEMAREYGVGPDQMLDLLRKNQAMEELHFRAISRKVSDFLIENADVKEVALAGKA